MVALEIMEITLILLILVGFCPKRGNKPCITDQRMYTVALTLGADVLPVFFLSS